MHSKWITNLPCFSPTLLFQHFRALENTLFCHELGSPSCGTTNLDAVADVVGVIMDGTDVIAASINDFVHVIVCAFENCMECTRVSYWHDSDGPYYDWDWYDVGDRCLMYENAYSNFG